MLHRSSHLHRGFSPFSGISWLNMRWHFCFQITERFCTDKNSKTEDRIILVSHVLTRLVFFICLKCPCRAFFICFFGGWNVAGPVGPVYANLDINWKTHFCKSIFPAVHTKTDKFENDQCVCKKGIFSKTLTSQQFWDLSPSFLLQQKRFENGCVDGQ